MKIEKYISLRDRVSLESKTFYCSTVVYEARDDKLVLAAPLGKTNLEIGSPIGLKVASLASLYSLEGSIEELNLKSDLPNIVIRVSGRPDRIQRRQDVRIPDRLPVRITIEDIKKSEALAGRLVDLSAGGASIEVDQTVPMGKELNLEFYLPADLNIYDLECKVVRSPKLLRKFPPKYNIGVAFTDLHRIDAERIVRYVFEKQRLLQKSRKR